MNPGLTVEPEPWPTADLILADWQTVTVSGRGLLTRARDGYYRTTTEGYYIREDRSGYTLRNVVVLTPVAAAQYRAMVEGMIPRHSDVGCDLHWRIQRRAVALADTTDALGLA